MLVIAKRTPACRGPNIIAELMEIVRKMIKDRVMCERVSASTMDDGERMCDAGNAAKERYKQTEQTGRERVW